MRMSGGARDRLAAGATFTTAALRYWLSVFPCVRRELGHWRHRARTAPDCTLRQMALAVQHTERGNIEGSAAFAVFAPRAHRPAVIRAQTAFQAIYDYVDTLAEQPHTDPIRNTRQLHRALLAALHPEPPRTDYYRHHPHRHDGGYLQAITHACHVALGTLPSYVSVAPSARRFAERIISYQSLNHTSTQGSYHALARWASDEAPPDTGLRWWETAASAGSSLGIFALIAAAAHTTVHSHETVAIERAYFPWIGSLHSLLDNLIDLPEDAATEQHNLIEHYRSPDETAARLGTLAAGSVDQARALPHGPQHAMILAGMASHYLSAQEAQLPHAKLAKSAVLDAIGDLAGPTMLVLRLRRAVHRPQRPHTAADSIQRP
jgi:tetraprenyl-beta-curcumene synthase